MGNKEWKVGDKILCVKPRNGRRLVSGQEYTIDGFACCPNCGVPCVKLKELSETVRNNHRQCGFRATNPEQEYFTRALFIRPDLSSLTEYRNQVSVREIPSELKILKNLEN